MLRSSLRLGVAELARAASLPAQLFAPVPAREAFLESLRQRNAVFDWLYYDVSCVEPEEAVRIAPRWAAEGAILTVPPTGAGPLRICTSIDAFLESGGSEISTLTVAGVGSSALGAAAFARNVADAITAPVAAVVSGFGLADVATEALGGFFLFGTINRLRHAFEGLDRLTQPAIVSDPSDWLDGAGAWLLSQSRDTRTVLALLEHEDLSFDLLAGHSKGNLVISEALFDLREHDHARMRSLAEKAKIVTIGACILMPTGFEVIDVMGEWDALGLLNSDRTIKIDHWIAGADHHTNTERWHHLPVTKTLAAVL